MGGRRVNAELQLLERVIYEIGPVGTILGLGFYWLRGQLDKLTTAIEGVEKLSREQEYTQACVSMIAKVQGIPLPTRKDPK